MRFLFVQNFEVDYHSQKKVGGKFQSSVFMPNNVMDTLVFLVTLSCLPWHYTYIFGAGTSSSHISSVDTT